MLRAVMSDVLIALQHTGEGHLCVRGEGGQGAHNHRQDDRHGGQNPEAFSEHELLLLLKALHGKREGKIQPAPASPGPGKHGGGWFRRATLSFPCTQTTLSTLRRKRLLGCCGAAARAMQTRARDLRRPKAADILL